MKRLHISSLSRWVVLTVGLVLGALIVLGIRYATYKPDQVHYHANFAVYMDEKRFEFKGPQYYQEVAICSATTGITIPQQRAHMHDDINSLIHVHDHAVTWGQFFENLGWIVGPDFIRTDDGTAYSADSVKKLHVVVNGQDYTDLTPITNTVIKDRDRLLLSFGDITDTTLQQEFKSVPSTAEHYDNAKDPASCAGTEKVTPSVRLHHLF
ncbi:MAG: hypothetical protein JWL89_196 [Candidatus Saccharibacteria bacterium]|jgi:hypothetical protein|nr:hypothetical protein [Candidatus Saccharibacteria bacterium]